MNTPRSSLGAVMLMALCVGTIVIGSQPSIASPVSEPSWKELDAHSFAEAKALRSLYQQSDANADLATIVLTLDKMVDPSIEIDATLKKINSIVATIQSMAGNNASDNDKLNAIRRYLYEDGPWNDQKVFQYDLDDPMGTALASKLIPQYLKTRKGNCVSMPLLFTILGQRMGLDITVARAPLHIFVKYTDRASGQVYNLEATSGGGVTRDEWLRQQMPMTDVAIKNGVYMRPLNRKETIGTAAMVLAEWYSQTQQYKKATLITDLIVENDPTNAEAMARNGFCFSRLMKKEFVDKYPRPSDIPPSERGYYEYLASNANFWYDKAESLGFVPPTDSQNANYLQNVNAAKSDKRNAE